MLVQPAVELGGRLRAGQQVVQQTLALAPVLGKLGAVMQRVENGELLQERQRGVGEAGAARLGGHGGDHALDAVHHGDVAKRDPVVAVLHEVGHAACAAQAGVDVPQPLVEPGPRRRRAVQGAAARVEQHDRHVDDVGDPVDQLAQVALLHDELEELDLQGGRAPQGVHVACRRVAAAQGRVRAAA